MENWQLDFEWLRIQNFLKETLQLSTLPDLNAALLFIGIQELGRWKKAFTKDATLTAGPIGGRYARLRQKVRNIKSSY